MELPPPLLPGEHANAATGSELEPGASKDEVQNRYLELLDRYDPDRQKDDAKKAVAQELTRKLREAYEGIKAYVATR